jgi:dynein heavy chain
MGQGQEIHARNMISDCIANGGWVLLQNMHLSLPFCTEAMDALSDSEEIHNTFRMWITTEVHPQFPIALLQVHTIIFLRQTSILLTIQITIQFNNVSLDGD